MNMRQRNAQIKRAIEKSRNPQRVGICPSCQGEVVAYPQTYACRDYPNGCDFSLRKNRLRRLGKEVITYKEMAALLRDEVIDLTDLIGREGRRFSCGGRLEWNETYGWSIAFCAQQVTRTRIMRKAPRVAKPRKEE